MCGVLLFRKYVRGPPLPVYIFSVRCPLHLNSSVPLPHSEWSWDSGKFSSNYLSSSTCSSECGTPSWACFWLFWWDFAVYRCLANPLFSKNEQYQSPSLRTDQSCSCILVVLHSCYIKHTLSRFCDLLTSSSPVLESAWQLSNPCTTLGPIVTPPANSTPARLTDKCCFSGVATSKHQGNRGKVLWGEKLKREFGWDFIKFWQIVCVICIMSVYLGSLISPLFPCLAALPRPQQEEISGGQFLWSAIILDTSLSCSPGTFSKEDSSSISRSCERPPYMVISGRPLLSRPRQKQETWLVNIRDIVSCHEALEWSQI